MVEALKLTRVRAGYGPTVVLEDVDLELSEHGSLAVLGRNGVGKTTLLATIMGHTTFHAGSIEYKGRPIMRLPVYGRARLGIGYVPQTRDVFPSLSVEENLKVAALPGLPVATPARALAGGRQTGRWTVERVYELFPRLAERRRHMGNQISGGEQQMLAIGRALMGSPSLLLLDEPLEGLAPMIVDVLLKAVQRLMREEALSMILVEQSAKLALGVTEQALVLNRGRIIHHGPSADLLADPARLTNLVVAG
jgi:branched-chain amino acid transport system ATP-binding protein